jgi:hypothetical protein
LEITKETFPHLYIVDDDSTWHGGDEVDDDTEDDQMWGAGHSLEKQMWWVTD